MTATIPSTEPKKLRAGETWRWRREDLTSDYPATTWTLKYALKNASNHLEITAVADGAQFAITVALSSTKTVAPGIYRMVGYVEDAGPVQRFPVFEAEVEVEAAYANAGVVDDRSHARKVLDAIEAVIENRATKDQEEYQIGHRSLRRTPMQELMALRDKYRGEVYAEELKDNASRGKGGGQLVVRF
jgi:hypothetical protein